MNIEPEFIIKPIDINPEFCNLWPLVKKNASFVAGGYFKDRLIGRNARDVDVFFYTQDHYAELYNKFMVSPFFTKKYLSSHAAGFLSKQDNSLVELVYSRFGTPEEILSTFDFTVSCCAVYRNDSDELEIIHHNKYIEHLEQRLIHIRDAPLNINQTVDRVFKYAGYGFSLDNEAKQRIFDEISVYEGSVSITTTNKKY